MHVAREHCGNTTYIRSSVFDLFIFLILKLFRTMVLPLHVDTEAKMITGHLTNPMDYLDTSPRDLDQTKKWVVGAAIVKATEAGSTHSYALLVLQRAVGNMFAGNWELAGGKVEATDASVRDAVAREVLEETGLKVSEVLGEIDDVHELKLEIDRKGLVPVRYAVAVENSNNITLSPEEHSQYRWVTLEDVDSLSMSPGMRKAVENACRFATAWAQEI